MKRTKIPPPFEMDAGTAGQYANIIRDCPRRLTLGERWRAGCLAMLQNQARTGRLPRDEHEALARYREEFGLPPWEWVRPRTGKVPRRQTAMRGHRVASFENV